MPNDDDDLSPARKRLFRQQCMNIAAEVKKPEDTVEDVIAAAKKIEAYLKGTEEEA